MVANICLDILSKQLGSPHEKVTLSVCLLSKKPQNVRGGENGKQYLFYDSIELPQNRVMHGKDLSSHKSEDKYSEERKEFLH